MSQPLNVITVASDGSVFGIDPQSNILQAVQAQSLIPIAGNLSSIGVASDGTIFGIGSPGVVFQYVGGSTGWQSMTAGPAAVTQLSAGNAANIWAVDGSSNVYQYVTGTGFTKIAAGISTVSATADNSVWGLDGQGNPQQYVAASKSWQPVSPTGPEPFVCLSAGAAAWVWALGKSGKVYQYDGTGNQWLAVTSELPVTLASLSCGGDTTVWALDTSGIAYSYSLQQQDWVFAAKPATGSLKIVSVADAGNIWALDTSGDIYQAGDAQITWNTISSGSKLTALSAAGLNNIWGLDSAGNAYRNTGGPSNWNPVQIPGVSLAMISAAADGTVFGTGAKGVFQYASASGVWEPVVCQAALVAVAAGSANNVWGLDGSGNIYQYQGGSEWQPVPGVLAQIAAAADGSVWGLTSLGQAFMYTGSSWYGTATYLKNVAVGSATNIWGIDATGDAVNVIAGATLVAEAASARLLQEPGSLLPAFDTENPFDEAQSTHLWIVNRAAQLAQGAPQFGSEIVQLIKPFQGQIGDPFHDNLCQGLYDADFLSAYNGPLLPPVVGTPTYASHFYDPDTGLNWLGSSSWTALMQGQTMFWQALEAYISNDMAAAGYSLGLGLHYFTDMMQPMHAANFTYLSSSSPGYHTAFESLVMENQGAVTTPTQFTAAVLAPSPGEYLINAAKHSKYNYFLSLTPSSIAKNYSWSNGLTNAQEQIILPLIGPILNDAIVFTSQYLYLWMTLAQSELTSCQIVSASSGMVLDIPNSSKKSGQQVQQYAWNNTGAQRFTLTQLTGADEGYFEIVAQCSNLCLDVQNNSAENAPVVQTAFTNSDSQKWQLTQIDEAAVSFQNKFSGLLLTVFPALSQSGSTLVQGTPESSGAQKFYVTPATPVFMQLVQTQVSGGLACDVTHGSSSPGTLLQVYNQNQSNSQTFLWVPLGGEDNGYSMILNQASGLVISGASGEVLEDIWNSSDGEKWRTVPVSPNSPGFYIQNKASGGYMTVAANQSGTPVTLSANPGSAFTFQSAPLNSVAALSEPDRPTPAPRVMHAGS